MAKIALITDQHFGVRNDSVQFSEYFRKFYKNVFFPYLEEHGIKTIIDLGDTFDRRKHINFISLHACREYWFDEISKRDMTLHVIVGNHCTAYKNTNEVNSPDLLLYGYDNVIVYPDPTDIWIDGLNIGILPWICSGNYDECMNYIRTTSASVLMGHLELAGFEMYRGSPSDHGFDHKLFNRFDMVFSGHFHHRSSRDNITYLGSPYEMTWSDWNDERGFHIFDTDTRELTYIQNPYKMFHKIHYDDSNTDEKSIMDLEVDQFSGSHVKVIVRNKTNPYLFDMFIDRLERAEVLDLQIVDDHLNLDSTSDEDIADDVENTLTLLKSHVQSIDNETLDKKRLESFLTSLYEEAMYLE